MERVNAAVYCAFVFQHGESGLLAAFQTADDLHNARQLVIDIPPLVIADHPATGAFADVNLVNGRAGSDHLPFGDEFLTTTHGRRNRHWRHGGRC